MLLTSKEIQEFLKISHVTLDKFLKKGLPVVKVGNLNRFEKEDVLDWFKSKDSSKGA